MLHTAESGEQPPTVYASARYTLQKACAETSKVLRGTETSINQSNMGYANLPLIPPSRQIKSIQGACSELRV